MAEGLHGSLSSTGLPSSADLDAVAAEQAARSATAEYPDRYIELEPAVSDPLAGDGVAPALVGVNPCDAPTHAPFEHVPERVTHEEAAARFVAGSPHLRPLFVDDFATHAAEMEGVCTPFPCPDLGIPPAATLSSVERWNVWVRIAERVGLITRERAACLILPVQVMPAAVEA